MDVACSEMWLKGDSSELRLGEKEIKVKRLQQQNWWLVHQQQQNWYWCRQQQQHKIDGWCWKWALGVSLRRKFLVSWVGLESKS